MIRRALLAAAALALLAMLAAALWMAAGNYTTAPLHNPGNQVGKP